MSAPHAYRCTTTATLLLAIACDPGTDAIGPRADGAAPAPPLPSHRCTERPIVDVSGQLDASDGDVAIELAQALDDATQNGWAAGLPPGHYPLARPLVMPADAVLVGTAGKTIFDASLAPGQWQEVDAMVEFVGMDGATLCDVVLDHHGEARDGDNPLSFTMLMADTAGNLVDGVEFRNPGSKSDAPGRPTGPALLMLARQPCPPASPPDTCDAAYFQSGADPGQPGSVVKNVVRNSTFTLEPEATVAFAIRIYTDFVRERPSADFTVAAASNAILDNAFEGDFAWNTVELAGGGTHHNVIEGNRFDGHTLTHVDLDKGVWSNLAKGNLIETAGRATLAYGPSYASLPTFAMADHGSGPSYRNRANGVHDNVVAHMDTAVPGDATLTAGIAVAHAIGARIQGNRVDDLYDGKRGVGVLVWGDTEKVDVVANLVGTLGPVAVGILAGVVAPGGVELGSAQLGLVENTVHTLQSAVIAGRVGAPALFPDLRLADNRLDTTATTLPALWLVGDKPVVTDNEIIGGNNVAQIGAPSAWLEGNRVGGSVGHTLQLGADATLHRNSAWGTGGASAHPHCQVAGGAVITMGTGVDVNDFTCP